jgi:hypothetical protein
MMEVPLGAAPLVAFLHLQIVLIEMRYRKDEMLVSAECALAQVK